MEWSVVGVVIRKFHEGDQKETLRFLKSIFRSWQNDQQWIWKFRETEKVFRRNTVIWVAEDAGRIVGHLAAIPMELRTGNGVLPVCQLVDGALDHKYRHKGIYTKIIREVLFDAERNGYTVSFGFANRPSYRIYAKEGSLRKVFEITQMFKILSFKNVFRTLHASLMTHNLNSTGGLSPFKDFFQTLRWRAISAIFDLFCRIVASAVSHSFESKSINTMSRIKRIDIKLLGERFDGQWPPFSSDYRFALERDRKYLDWRYSNPEAEYGVCVVENGHNTVGYVVTAVEQKTVSVGKITLDGLKVGFIVDLIGQKDLTALLVSAAEEELKKQKVCFVSSWTTENSPFFDSIKRVHYHKFPREINKVTMVAAVHHQDLQSAFSSDCGKDVLVMLSDGDLV